MATTLIYNVNTNTKNSMGIFDFVFGKTIKIEDEFFGRMIFSEFKKNPEKNYFECRRYFKPTDEVIEIGIEGNATGPNEFQKEFFRKIESNFDNIISSIKPMVENEFQNWKEDFKIADFKKEFNAVYLYIPRCENQTKIWEIAFESDHDLNHTFTLTMNNFIAKEILIDG